MNTKATLGVVIGITLLAVGCSTRIRQQAGRDGTIVIHTESEVGGAAAVGNNPNASVQKTQTTTKGF